MEDMIENAPNPVLAPRRAAAARRQHLAERLHANVQANPELREFVRSLLTPDTRLFTWSEVAREGAILVLLTALGVVFSGAWGLLIPVLYLAVLAPFLAYRRHLDNSAADTLRRLDHLEQGAADRG